MLRRQFHGKERSQRKVQGGSPVKKVTVLFYLRHGCGIVHNINSRHKASLSAVHAKSSSSRNTNVSLFTKIISIFPRE